MTDTQELTKKVDEKARRAIRDSVGAVLEAKGALDAYVADGKYSEVYIEERRSELAAKTREAVSGYLDTATTELAKAQTDVAFEIEAARAFEPAEIAAATAQLQIVLGNSLQGNPERLLEIYEGFFDDPVDRRVLEDFGEKLFKTLPDNPVNNELAGRWQDLQTSLVDRLPEDAPERVLMGQAAELAEAGTYLQSAGYTLGHDLDRLAGQERADTIAYRTERHAATLYEAQRHDEGESPVGQLPDDSGLGGNTWEPVSTPVAF